MRHSIRTKVTFSLIAIVALMIALSGLLSVMFIKKYYYNEIKNQIIETYRSCNEEFSMRGSYDVGNLNSRIKNDAGAVVFIVDDIRSAIYTTVNENTEVFANLQYISDILKYNNDIDAYDSRIEREDVENYKNFRIQITKDTETDFSYFDLIGYLDNGFIIIIRTSVSSLDATVRVTVKFVLMILSVVAVIGCILMYFFSNIFAKPIKKLTKVAERMTKLDFDAKSEYTSKDEIGELSMYMNDLSFKLKNTLTELQQANERLQSDINEKTMIDEMRKEFLSHVSHELKTPIALIQGYAEGLKDNIIEDEDSKEFYCDVIVDEAAKMNQLVRQLLDLNEIEFGENRINKEVFDMNALIQNVIAASSILIEQNGVHISYQETEPLHVYADEFMIEEVFTNYLTNAIHYCNAGGTVKVWTVKALYQEPVMTDEHHKLTGNVRIFVSDEGPNIPQEEMAKVFDKFYKIDKARTREYGGSGIGLSIVAASMQAHNKNYGVYNIPDGVVFYFDLVLTL